MRAAPLVLHGYWRSCTSYRTRIALNAKGLAFDQVAHDLRAGEQRSEAYRALNPQGLVPALETDGEVLSQSTAIIEWLDERYPDPPLLPDTAQDRAIVRAMSLLVACDVHPLNNIRVLNRLKDEFGADRAAVKEWIGHWIAEGFTALEAMIVRHGGQYCFGDSLTMADCHIVPQVYSAERFAIPLDAYPRLVETIMRVRENPAVAAAHPDLQPDAS
ncbi:MAG TPA: maleylacetoacetate isomerase [Novosphingobium sp.]|nr:maleylacetoacetate isomerase [Novosphingobium sp.]